MLRNRLVGRRSEEKPVFLSGPSRKRSYHARPWQRIPSTAPTQGAKARRSRAAMIGPWHHEMCSQIPYVQPHTPRCETSTSGGTAGRPARTHASLPEHRPACVLYMSACIYVRTIRHRLTVRGSKSIQYQTGYCAICPRSHKHEVSARKHSGGRERWPERTGSTQHGTAW